MTVVKSGTVVPDGRLTRMHNRKRVGAFCFGIIIIAITFGLCGAMDAWADTPLADNVDECKNSGGRPVYNQFVRPIAYLHCHYDYTAENTPPPSYHVPDHHKSHCSGDQVHDECGNLVSYSIYEHKPKGTPTIVVMGYFRSNLAGSVRLYKLTPISNSEVRVIPPVKHNPPSPRPTPIPIFVPNYTATPSPTPTPTSTPTPTLLDATTTSTPTPTSTPACVWEDGVCVIYPEGTATTTPTPTATPQSPYGSVTPTPTGTSYPPPSVGPGGPGTGGPDTDPPQPTPTPEPTPSPFWSECLLQHAATPIQLCESLSKSGWWVFHIGRDGWVSTGGYIPNVATLEARGTAHIDQELLVERNPATGRDVTVTYVSDGRYLRVSTQYEHGPHDPAKPYVFTIGRDGKYCFEQW